MRASSTNTRELFSLFWNNITFSQRVRVALCGNSEVDNMEILTAVKDIHKVIKNCLLSDYQKQSFMSKLNSIESRWYDTNLYVGIVGEFSSGKSTLINSLIGRDYFVTNSLQGTTTVVTSICYGKEVNLELRYKNGVVEKYSSNKLSMIEKFLPDDYAKLSFSDKIKFKAGDIFSANGKDNFMLKIFDLVTTSNSLAEELDEVVVHYPSEFLRGGIVLLDTPGTDSLNPKHTEITVNALANKCNIAFVIIPSDSPVSMTLSDFISQNLNHCIDDCHFLLTKIELVRKEKDREELMSWVTNRLKDNLGVDNPHVIAAPTLLSLEEKNSVSPSGLLEDLKQNAKDILVRKYDEEIAHLFQHLSDVKKQLLHASVCKRLENVTAQLLCDLTELSARKQNDLQDRQLSRTLPLGNLLDRVDKRDLSMNLSVALDRIKSNFSEVRSEFESVVDDLISEADTKTEIQKAIRTEKAVSKGIASFKECYEHVIQQTNWLIESYKSAVAKFNNDFENHYSLQPLEYFPDADSKSIVLKEYKDSFSSFPLSTFPLKRMFIKKETIRAEARQVMGIYIEKSLQKLNEYYLPKISKIDEKLSKQLDKLLQQYLRKFTKVINSRIKQEFELEKMLEAEIKLINQHIMEVQNLPSQYSNN